MFEIRTNHLISGIFSTVTLFLLLPSSSLSAAAPCSARYAVASSPCCYACLPHAAVVHATAAARAAQALLRPRSARYGCGGCCSMLPHAVAPRVAGEEPPN